MKTTTSGKQLANWLASNNVTLRAFAARLGVSERAPGNWIAGWNDPSESLKLKIRQMTGIKWVKTTKASKAKAQDKIDIWTDRLIASFEAKVKARGPYVSTRARTTWPGHDRRWAA